MKKYKDAVKSIQTEHIDVKAEAIIADLLEDGIDLNDIEIMHDGTFERNYKKDLTDVYVDMVRKVISLHISRNSLYDNLPEGIFHPVSRYSNLEADERKKEFKKQKLEEEKARRFFRPFDNEFLLQKVKLEIETRKILDDPFAVIEKWFLNESKIPQKYFRHLVRFLPFTNKIKGNLDLTTQCLSEILEESVTSKRFYSTLTTNPSPSNVQNKLGGRYLGENFILGNSLNEDVLTWEFTISVFDEKKLEHYVDVNKGFMKSLINQFCDYFVPIEIMVKTKIICSKQNAFYLRGNNEHVESKSDPSKNYIYLGYNTIL